MVRRGASTEEKDFFFFLTNLEKKTPPNVFECVTLFFLCNSFTDLSAAGLPAELKHITQRRKRKQP